ncbi:MAG: tetratricopeptide repeat protein [Prosthecobacter sp.]|nr:tetratricopeptide repeat protein [Prosthecobacter sp.]
MKTSILIAHLLAAAAALHAAGPLPNLWENPVFQKHLIGSFGINSEIEPPFRDDNESADYEKISGLIQNEPDKALDYLLKLSAVPGASARMEFAIANILFQKDRRVEAEKFFLRAIEKFPSYRQAHNNLAIMYVQGGDHARAITHFTEAIRLGSSDGTTYGLLGVSYLGIGKFLAAEGAFRNAMLLRPDVKDWEMGLVQALLRQEKWAEIISILNRLIEANPNDATLWELQAGAYLGQKNSLAAAANYEIMDKLGKLTPDQLSTLGDIYISEGMMDVAADAYLRAFEKAGVTAGVDRPLRAAEILLSREGYDAARNLVQRVSKSAGSALKPADQRRLLKVEAKIDMAAGRQDAAAKSLENIVSLDPLDGDSLILLGQYYQGKGENEKAIARFEQAASVPEHEAAAKVRHAQLLVSTGKYDLAVPLLKRAQEIKPNDSVARFLEDLERFLKTRR